ncbi:MAG TPA: 50S ribosomal protein L11 methyltransferase [Longimicrobiaceae bacterium]|nr:50S ribosomal protein L11 methyltransferase [Longimicrobiaceae bacterium]
MTVPERWLVLSARLPPAAEGLAPLVAEGLLVLGGSAVEERGDALTTYLLPPEDPESFVAGARERLAEWLPGEVVPELSWCWQENEDWARKWKEGLRPRRITDRVVVKPTWTEWEAAEGEVVIDIDPQMAFGTGEHATTRGCLRLLAGAVRPGDRVLDVGSGSAILAIAAARLGASEAIAVEHDPDANLNARENLELNGVGDRVRIVESLADPALLAGLGRFDLVLANILSSVIRPLLPAFRDTLGASSEGRLIVSGILRDEYPGVVRDAEAAGFRVVRTDEEAEWWSALLVPAGPS